MAGGSRFVEVVVDALRWILSRPHFRNEFVERVGFAAQRDRAGFGVQFCPLDRVDGGAVLADATDVDDRAALRLQGLLPVAVADERPWRPVVDVLEQVAVVQDQVFGQPFDAMGFGQPLPGVPVKRAH